MSESRDQQAERLEALAWLSESLTAIDSDDNRRALIAGAVALRAQSTVGFRDCPCENGQPDPCPKCGADAATGICGIDPFALNRRQET